MTKSLFAAAMLLFATVCHTQTRLDTSDIRFVCAGTIPAPEGYSLYESDGFFLDNSSRTLGFNYTHLGVNYSLQVEIRSDTSMYEFERLSFNDVHVTIGEQSVNRTHSKMSDKFAFVFTAQRQSTCAYCVHFDGGIANDVWFEPDGTLYFNKIAVTKDFGAYLQIVSTLIQTEQNSFIKR